MIELIYKCDVCKERTYDHSCYKVWFNGKTIELVGQYHQKWRDSLPKLPVKWEGPFVERDGNVFGKYDGGVLCFALDCGERNAQFLADLLNVCYKAIDK